MPNPGNIYHIYRDNRLISFLEKVEYVARGYRNTRTCTFYKLWSLGIISTETRLHCLVREKQEYSVHLCILYQEQCINSFWRIKGCTLIFARSPYEKKGFVHCTFKMKINHFQTVGEEGIIHFNINYVFSTETGVHCRLE